MGEDSPPAGGGSPTGGHGSWRQRAGLACRAAWYTPWTDTAPGQPPPHACGEQRAPHQC